MAAVVMAALFMAALFMAALTEALRLCQSERLSAAARAGVNHGEPPGCPSLLFLLCCVTRGRPFALGG